MPHFDFITLKEFRDSLETDYAEMGRCIDALAWKSAQVLAGSIAESLLIDYLKSTNYPQRPAKDPLKMDLGEAIGICLNEKILSQRTADLCSVIKSYRNLIHPGRIIRMEEPPPSKDSATIAMALVDLIIGELAKARRDTVGLTAEQIVSKITRDSNAVTILKHLLPEVSETEKERLLTDLIPKLYFDAAEPDVPWNDLRERLERSYRLILESAPEKTKIKVAMEFVRTLREDGSERVTEYGKIFNISDISYIPEQHRPMVVEHFLSSAPSIHNANTAQKIDGIASYLTPNDVMKWLDPFIRVLISTTTREPIRQMVRGALLGETFLTSTEVDKRIDSRLNDWVRHFKDDEEKKQIIIELKSEIQSQRGF